MFKVHVYMALLQLQMSKYLTKSSKIKTILSYCGKSYIRQGGELLSPDLGTELYPTSFLRKVIADCHCLPRHSLNSMRNMWLFKNEQVLQRGSNQCWAGNKQAGEAVAWPWSPGTSLLSPVTQPQCMEQDKRGILARPTVGAVVQKWDRPGCSRGLRHSAGSSWVHVLSCEGTRSIEGYRTLRCTQDSEGWRQLTDETPFGTESTYWLYFELIILTSNPAGLT